MKKTNIAFVISDMGSGGAQKMAAALLNHWAAQGHSVTLLTLDDGFHDFFNINQNVKKIRLGEIKPSKNLWQGLWANIRRVWAIRRALQMCAPQIVISFIAPTNILVVLACMGLKTRVVISERNDPARQSFGLFWNGLRRVLYRFADGVNANSKGAMAALRAYVPAHKLSFIPNMVDVPEVAAFKPLSEREPIILAVGRLHPQKGFDVLLKALAIFIQERPDWRVMIVGQGPEEQALKALAKEKGLRSCVSFEGLQKDMAPYYARARIFALSSRHEGTPNALLEAMAYGVAPVMSDACAGALDIWDPVPADLVFENENPQSLARRLLDLSAQADKAQAHGQAARQAVMALQPAMVYARWDELL